LLVPVVIEKTSSGERSYDLYSRLLKERIVFFGSDVNPYSANVTVAQLLYLESVSPESDINLYINSPGGTVTDAFAIYDAMNYIKSDVATIALGQAASAGAFLLSAGAKGKRFALPNSRIMIHQPSGGAGGPATDIQIHAKEILRMKATLNQLFADHTGQPLEKIEEDMERDKFLTSQQALDYGIIDHIISRRA